MCADFYGNLNRRVVSGVSRKFSKLGLLYLFDEIQYGSEVGHGPFVG